jgi:hypothetical protein
VFESYNAAAGAAMIAIASTAVAIDKRTGLVRFM